MKTVLFALAGAALFSSAALANGMDDHHPCGIPQATVNAVQSKLAKVVALADAKAETANDFSNSALALSTANLYAPTQPGGSLYGLNNSNPFNPFFNEIGTGKGPGGGVGQNPGGIITFGGGVALYSGGKVIGGLGVSGDSSRARH